MRRLLAGAALAAVGFTVVVPLASAHVDGSEHVLVWQNPSNPSGPRTANDGGEVWSNDEVVGAYANFPDGIRSWDVVIRPVNGGPASTCHEDLAQSGTDYPTELYINCPWDTTRATEHTLAGATPEANAKDPRFQRTWQSRDLGPAPNGKYTVEITVTNAGKAVFKCGLLVKGCEPRPVEPHPLYQTDSNPPRWRELFVVNEVANPGGVGSAFDQGTNRISVTWGPNPEPDVTYVVQEKIGDEKWSAGVGVAGTRYERTLDQPGKYQYRVAAVRPAPTRDRGDATKRSEYVAASVVDVAHITPPTTAGSGAGANGGGVGSDGAPGGGDAGVFVPTDSPTGTTAPGARGGSPGRNTTTGRPSGSSARPSGSSSRPTGSTSFELGEAEGMGPDDGFSAELPYYREEGDPVFDEEDDGSDEEAGPETLAGGVVPKPRDTRQLLIYMASALTLFVFAMQLTVLLRRTKPALAPAQDHYHDDFDDWLGF